LCEGIGVVEIYWRGLEGEDSNPQGLEVHPFMKDWEGNYHELDAVRIEGMEGSRIAIREGKLSNMSRATRNYMATNPKPRLTVKVSKSKFFQAIRSYKAAYEGKQYHIIKPSLTNPFKDNCIGFKDYVINYSKVK